MPKLFKTPHTDTNLSPIERADALMKQMAAEPTSDMMLRWAQKLEKFVLDIVKTSEVDGVKVASEVKQFVVNNTNKIDVSILTELELLSMRELMLLSKDPLDAIEYSDTYFSYESTVQHEFASNLALRLIANLADPAKTRDIVRDHLAYYFKDIKGRAPLASEAIQLLASSTQENIRSEFSDIVMGLSAGSLDEIRPYLPNEMAQFELNMLTDYLLPQFKSSKLST